MGLRTSTFRSLTIRVARNLTALVLGLAVALLAAEAAVRVVPRGWVPELEPVPQTEIHLRGLARTSANPRLHTELTPGASEWGVNSLGYRGPEYPVAKPNDAKRIVGIGDSSLFGFGVREDDAYLRRLETLCHQNGLSNVEVINLGVPGYNTDQELEMLRSRGLAYDPDLIILGYDHNDPRPVPGRIRGRMPDDYGENVLHSEFIRYVRRKLLLIPHAGFRPHVDGYLAGGRDWERHFDTLSEFAKELRDRGVPVVVVVHDSRLMREDKEKSRHWRLLHEPFQPFWKTHGFHVVDCYDLFQDYMRRQHVNDVRSLWVSREKSDAHPNPEGHRIIGEALFETIERLGLLAPSDPGGPIDQDFARHRGGEKAGEANHRSSDDPPSHPRETTAPPPTGY